MKKLLVWAVALTMVFATSVPAMAADPGDGGSTAIPIVAVEAQDQAGVDALNAAGLDIISVGDDYVVFIMVKDFEREYFAANGTEYTVVEEDATADVEWLGYATEDGGLSLFSAPITGIPGQAGTGVPALYIDTNAMFDPDGISFDSKYGFPERLGYRTVSEYYGEMNYLAKAYPDLVKKHVIGYSVENVPIVALEISNAPGANDGRPNTFHMAGNHSREWPTNELAMNLTWYLLTQYNKNAEVTGLLNSTTVWMVPMSNPDGVHYDQRNNPGTWRKNRSLNADGTYGVDINRNWSYRWGSNNGSASQYSSETYRGVAPNSEPEIQAITSVYKNNQIISSISGHTSGQLVIFAWAYINNPNNADPLLTQLAREQANINMHADQNGNVMYAQSGEINDYLWGAVRALGYTYEYGTSFVPVYGGYERYKAVAPYTDYYGNQRRIPVTYPTAAAAVGARAPAADLTAPVVFLTDPFIIGYGSADRFSSAAKVNALGDLTGKILMTHQADGTANNTAVVLAAQAKGAVGVIFCGQAISGGGYGHYTPSLAGNNVNQITIPVAGTSKPYLREFNEYVLNGGTNTITLTSYTENTDSLYSQFERQIGAYMLNMSFAKTYASHITGRILDANAQPIPNAALDLEIEIESLIMDTGGNLLPAGTFMETQTAHYDVTGGNYNWNVLPSKQPEFADRGYDITASASGKYSATQNVKIANYQTTVPNINFTLPTAISSTFNFNQSYAAGAPVTIPFETYTTLGIVGDAGPVSASINGAPAAVTTLSSGSYSLTFTPTVDAEIVFDFGGGAAHSAFTAAFDVAEAAVSKAQVSVNGPTSVTEGSDVTYLLSVSNASAIGSVFTTFEVTGTDVDSVSAEAIGGFDFLVPVEWQTLHDGTLKGKAILWTNRDINAADLTDILKVSFNAGALGSVGFKVTDLSLARVGDIPNSNNPPNSTNYVPFDIVGSGGINTNVTSAYSVYDIDRNGVVDQLDLARAQYYFMVQVGDIRWNSSNHIGYRADVNGDGVVDIIDLVEILANIA
jgi:murein tripeptide amidase MpaA